MEPNSPHQNSVGHSSPSTGSNNTSLVAPVGVHAAVRMANIVQSMNRLLMTPFCQPQRHVCSSVAFCGYPFPVEAAKLTTRIVVSSLAGIVTFLGTMTARCNDVGGVPSWERCWSWLGNSIIEWPGGNFAPLLPLALGIGISYFVWWLLGFTPLKSSK